MDEKKLKVNPQIAEQLRQAREELAKLKEEKRQLYPPNPFPLAQPDDYPSKYTPEQIRRRNELNARIEALEQRVDELELRLYSK